MIVCPGGAYNHVVVDKEGTEIAAWLNSNGISAVVLKYRVPTNRAGALQDVARYVQTLPGVSIGSNDFRNDIIVRGGSPLENLFIVDNIEIPNINAFANFASAGGTVSLLDAELIKQGQAIPIGTVNVTR